MPEPLTLEQAERAAIMEFDGGLTRVEAEAQARLPRVRGRLENPGGGSADGMSGDHDGTARARVQPRLG